MLVGGLYPLYFNFPVSVQLEQNEKLIRILIESLFDKELLLGDTCLETLMLGPDKAAPCEWGRCGGAGETCE